MNNDLISRSALLEKATGVVTYDEGGWDCNVRAVLVADVLKAPAVDAVEVVRCKDCKRRGDPDRCPMCYEVPVYQCNGEDSDGELCWDVWEEIEDRTIDDSFCSYGERRADDA